jgi:hypothetical protein
LVKPTGVLIVKIQMQIKKLTVLTTLPAKPALNLLTTAIGTVIAISVALLLTIIV